MMQFLIQLATQFIKKNKEIILHQDVEFVKTCTTRWRQSLHLSNDRMGKSPVCQLAYIFLTGNHLAHFFWQHKIDRNIELILNTFVKRKRTDILVLQMVGPRHGVSDANS